MRDGKVFARIEEMTVRDEKGNHFTLGEPVRTDLPEMDVSCSGRTRPST
jgi:glutathione synthase